MFLWRVGMTPLNSAWLNLTTLSRFTKNSLLNKQIKGVECWRGWETPLIIKQSLIILQFREIIGKAVTIRGSYTNDGCGPVLCMWQCPWMIMGKGLFDAGSGAVQTRDLSALIMSLKCLTPSVSGALIAVLCSAFTWVTQIIRRWHLYWLILLDIVLLLALESNVLR